MYDLKIFENEEFGTIRTMIIDNEVWFVGRDVTKALGYVDTFGAIKKHVDPEDKQNCQNDSFETPRGMTVINESGLYSLILGSKLPAAKEFKHWVTHEVLPTIRKTGRYSYNKEDDFKENYIKAAEIMARCQDDTEVAHWVRNLLESAGFEFDGNKGEPKRSDNQKSYRNNLDNSFKSSVTQFNPKIIDGHETWCVSDLSRVYNMSSRQINKKLESQGVQHKVGNIWFLNDEYANKGLALHDNFFNHTGTLRWTSLGCELIDSILLNYIKNSFK